MSTLRSVLEEVGTAPPIVAQWLRIPDAVRASGLGRSSIYSLLRQGKIRSVVVRPTEGMKGIRLIHAESLNRYIASQETAYRESIAGRTIGTKNEGVECTA